MNDHGLLTAGHGAHLAHYVAAVARPVKVIPAPSSVTRTITQVASVIAAVAGGCAAVVSAINRRHINEVHLLVNGNLAKIREELDDTKVHRDRLELDVARKRTAGSRAAMVTSLAATSATLISLVNRARVQRALDVAVATRNEMQRLRDQGA